MELWIGIFILICVVIMLVVTQEELHHCIPFFLSFSFYKVILNKNEKHRSLYDTQLNGTISIEFGNLTQLRVM